MPEAEELLIDAARHASVAAHGLWRRLRPAQPGSAQQWLLEDFRLRVALLLEAVLGVQLEVRNAQAPAPASWVARLLRRQVGPRPGALPANDGSAIYLPTAIAALPIAERKETNSNDYALLGLLQGLRVVRGSASCYALCESPLAADLFLLAEASAADRALRDLLPGWGAALDSLYARMDGAITRLCPAGSIYSQVLGLYRSILRRTDEAMIPPASSVQASLEWAHRQASILMQQVPRERYRQWLEDPVIGRILQPEAKPLPLAAQATQASRRAARASLDRRPRARSSEADEDDAQPGVWMVQTSEPQEHAEDPLGMNRPQDRSADADLEGAAQSLAELKSARLVSTPGQATDVLYSDDPPPRLERATEEAELNGAHAYPEWDCRSGSYGTHPALVHVACAAAGSHAWVDSVLRRHAGTLRTLRRRLGIIRPHRQILPRRTEGDDIDCDAVVDERCIRRAGGAPTGAVYLQHRRAPRRIGLLLLIDTSASTDAWVTQEQRVIDIAKEAALVAACALHTTGAEFAVLCFSGEGKGGVQVRIIKDFAQPWNEEAMCRIAALEPDRYTRLGGAVRHACAMLARQAVDFRLLLLFSDGRPNDCDLYASAYGLEDSRQALIEARIQRIEPFCFTVDREGTAYLPHLFGNGRYTIVQHAQQLPLAFVDWLRTVARRIGR